MFAAQIQLWRFPFTTAEAAHEGKAFEVAQAFELQLLAAFP